MFGYKALSFYIGSAHWVTKPIIIYYLPTSILQSTSPLAPISNKHKQQVVYLHWHNEKLRCEYVHLHVHKSLIKGLFDPLILLHQIFKKKKGCPYFVLRLAHATPNPVF